MEQYITNAFISALPTVMAFACVALLLLRLLAYNRSGFLAVSCVTVCNQQGTRPNPEVPSNTSGGLLGLDVLSLCALFYGAQLNWHSSVSGVLLSIALLGFLVFGFMLATHNFRIAMSTVKDESSIIPPAQRADILGLDTFAGLLTCALMFA